MGAFSNYAEKKIIDHIYNRIAWVTGQIWIGLATGAMGEGGATTNEFVTTTGAYWRVAVNKTGGAAPAFNGGTVDGTGYVVDPADTISFPTATATWGTATHFFTADASLAGNIIQHGALDDSRTIKTGDTFKFPAGTPDLRVE